MLLRLVTLLEDTMVEKALRHIVSGEDIIAMILRELMMATTPDIRYIRLYCWLSYDRLHRYADIGYAR